VWVVRCRFTEVGGIYFGKMARSLKSRLACLAVALLTLVIGVALEFYVSVIVPIMVHEYYSLIAESQRCWH
jgi:hypothetical protein